MHSFRLEVTFPWSLYWRSFFLKQQLHPGAAASPRYLPVIAIMWNKLMKWVKIKAVAVVLRHIKRIYKVRESVVWVYICFQYQISVTNLHLQFQMLFSVPSPQSKANACRFNRSDFQKSPVPDKGCWWHCEHNQFLWRDWRETVQNSAFQPSCKSILTTLEPFFIKVLSLFSVKLAQVACDRNTFALIRN